MSYSVRPREPLSFWQTVNAVVLALVLISVFDAVLGIAFFFYVQRNTAYELEKFAYQSKHELEEQRVRVAQEQLHQQTLAKEKHDRDQAAYAAAHALKPNEACIGGSVVSQTTQPNGTSAYVQVLEFNRPVPCSGDRRL